MMFVAYDVCRIMTFVAQDVCRIVTFVSYRACRCIFYTCQAVRSVSRSLLGPILLVWHRALTHYPPHTLQTIMVHSQSQGALSIKCY